MGFLDRFRRLTDVPEGAPPAVVPLAAVVRGFDVFEGNETLEVVGESYRQDTLWEVVGGYRRGRIEHPITAVLWPEPFVGDGRDDPNAVQVLIHERLVGYLSRHDASIYKPGIDELMGQCPSGRVALRGIVCGGGDRYSGPPLLGVFLDHDPALFGLTPRRASAMGGFRTGLSEAIATDLEDDSYDLSWLSGLPASDGPAIKTLRKLLEAERDPIDRHYMHCTLESRLYACRDAFESALIDYDAACDLHHSDMDKIRPALFEKFGRMPILDTYRQRAIRAQKARDWDGVQLWAERGIELYGQDAAHPEAVQDLQKRLAYGQSKAAAAAKRANRA